MSFSDTHQRVRDVRRDPLESHSLVLHVILVPVVVALGLQVSVASVAVVIARQVAVNELHLFGARPQRPVEDLAHEEEAGVAGLHHVVLGLAAPAVLANLPANKEYKCSKVPLRYRKTNERGFSCFTDVTF